MYENMVDVLIYLYENYMDGERRPPGDQGELEEELSQAGFGNREIEKALRWLDELAAGAETSPHHPYAERSIRLYSAAEAARLDLEARGLLLFLEQSGILDPESEGAIAEDAQAALRETAAHQPAHVRRDDEALAEAVRVALRRHLFKAVGKKPVTRVHLVRVA